jgi:hypothetical protein
VLALVLKLTLAPALVAVATLAARRSGPRAGGLISGLPVVAGPIALVVAIEQGKAFLDRAAVAAILGMVASIAFCVTYATVAQRSGVTLALTAAGVVYAVMIAAFLPIHLALVPASAVTLAAIAAGSWQLRRLAGREAGEREPVRSLLGLRMAITAVLVVALTGAAGHLSAHAAGLLIPVPIITAVMAGFTHAQAGPVAAARLLAGLVEAYVAFLAFFATLAVALPDAGNAAAFGAATGASLLVWLALVCA